MKRGEGKVKRGEWRAKRGQCLRATCIWVLHPAPAAQQIRLEYYNGIHRLAVMTVNVFITWGLG